MKKTWMKRMIAVGLIALMACVNPMQTVSQRLSKAAEATAADAESSDDEGDTGASYIREVRIGVGKTAEEAKASLDGYEILDQDINEGAGSWWNKIGDQAVFLGYKTTTKESEALRDIKLMNMLGKYSVSGYELWLNENKAQAKSLYEQVRPAITEFTSNYEKKDKKTLALYDMLNHLKEDDSGKSIAELIVSGGMDEDTFIKLMVQGNSTTVNVMLRLIAAGCEGEPDTWIERLQTCNTYNDVVKAYAEKKGLSANVTGTAKKEIEDEIARDLQSYAMKLADLWPTFRSSITDVADEIENGESSSDESATEGKEGAEAVNAEVAEAVGLRDENITIFLQTAYIREPDLVEKKGEMKLDQGVTLYDFFTQKTNSVSKNNAKALIPLAYVLTEGQRSMLEYTDLFDLSQIALERISLRDEVQKQVEDSKEVTESVNEGADSYVNEADASIYEGVDRSAYLGNTAKTSAAQAEETSTGAPATTLFNNYLMWGGVALGTGFLIGAGIAHIVNSRNVQKINAKLNEITQKLGNLGDTIDVDEIQQNFNAKLQRMELGKNQYINSIKNKTDRVEQYMKIYNKGVEDAKAATQKEIQDATKLNDEISKLNEEQRSLESAKNSIAPKAIQIAAVVLSAVMFAYSAYEYIKLMKAEHNIEQLPIPERMVDFDVTNEAGKYVNYTSVKWQKDRSAYLQEGEKVEDRADRADLNGDAAKQWLVPYVTYDSAAGKPILAEGLTVKLGNNDSDPMSAPADGKDYTYQSLRIFHQENAQNLVDEAYSFKDKMGGIYLFYRVAREDTSTAVATEETKSDTGAADNEASSTGSLTSSGNTILFTTLGAVGGLLIGLFIGIFFRRKKVKPE